MGTESLWQLQVYYLSSKSTFYELLLWEYLGTYTPFAVSIILIFVNRGHLRDIAEKGAFFWFRCAVLMLLTPILQLAEMHAWRHPEMLCHSFKLRAHNPLGSLQHEPWPKDHLADALWMWTQHAGPYATLLVSKTLMPRLPLSAHPLALICQHPGEIFPICPGKAVNSLPSSGLQPHVFHNLNPSLGEGTSR